MAFPTSIGAGIFSDIAIATPIAPLTAPPANEAAWKALFATEAANVGGVAAAGAFVRIQNVREYPAIGTPANIVNVPVYGAPNSSQVQGQSDAPDLSLTLNYVASDWAPAGTLLGPMVGDGVQRAFRFALLNAKPTATTTAQYASTAPGLGTVPNAQFYWMGKLEALVVNPQLTDANQATLTLTIQGAFAGAYTI